MMTSTSVDLDEELLNQCLILTVDESPAQTARIHARQRHQMTLQGLLADEARANIVRLHKNAQRLLRPIKVLLPDADSLRFPELRVRARRDFRKLLGLVEVIALLHQHPREAKSIEHEGATVEFIETTVADIEVAQQLLDHVGGAGVDDLPPATRKLLVQLDEFVTDVAARENKSRPEIRFSRRQVREALGVGDTQCKVHLRRLVDSEFILAHRAPHGRGVIYSLAFNGHGYDAERAADGRPLVGPRSAQGRPKVGGTSDRLLKGLTPANDAAQGKRRDRASRKRSLPPSQEPGTVGSSRRTKRRRR
jgi:DNA primase